MRRLVRRTNEALECSRTSSAWRAVTSVSRGRRFSPPVLRCGLAGAAGLAAPPGRRERGASSSSGSVIWVRASAPTLIFGLASSSAPPNRFLASCSALRLASSSCRRRSSSSRLRASAASRSVRSIASRSSRMCACSSAILRSSASLRRASASASTRARCSSAVSVLSTRPEGLVGEAVADWPRPAGAPDRLPVTGIGAAGAGGGGSTLALPGARVFTFSTSTCLVRPWLKFWRTTLCSTPRAFSDSVLLEPTLNFFSPVFSVVSAIPLPVSRGFRTMNGAGPEALKARYTRQKCLTFGARNQDCMYHICPPECQIQLRNGKCVDDHDVFSIWPLPQGSLELACAILAGIGGLDQGGNPFPAERGLYSGKANGGPTGL